MTANLIDTTWVAVADGEKGMILLNTDTDENPILDVLRKEEIDNPPTREQAANRRGRMNDNGMGHRSAVDDTDWHELGKERFNDDFAEILNKAALNNAYDRLILIAPPQTLGRLRPNLHKETEKRLIKDDPSDLTNLPIDKIEAHIAAMFDKGEPDWDADLRRSS